MESGRHPDLLKCDKENTPYYTLEGHVYICKCVKVYDGDTITVVFMPMGLDEFYKYNIRLSGIDTPEIRTKNPHEKKQAIVVRDFVREKILNKLITIKCDKFDKYGRLMADVYGYGESQSINDLLIQMGYAYKYNGGTKKKYVDLHETGDGEIIE